MCQPSWCRWRWKKGPKQRWSGYFSLCPFPSWKGVFSQNGPQRSRARRCCAAKRTLHGEDRSEILDKRERGGPKWTAKMAQSLTASDIMDEKSVESRSQQTGSFLVAAAGQDAVDRRVAGDRDPQPPGVSSHFPARFVHGDAGTHPDLADEILVGRFALFSQARQSLAQPAGCQGQAKSLVQNGRGFAQGHPQFFVQDGRQRQGFRTHLRGGRSQGVGGLAGITTLDSFATFRAVADLDMKTGHPCLAHDLGLILVLHVPALHGTRRNRGYALAKEPLFPHPRSGESGDGPYGRSGLRAFDRGVSDRSSARPWRKVQPDASPPVARDRVRPSAGRAPAEVSLFPSRRVPFHAEAFRSPTQLLIFVFELFDSMTSSYAEQYHPAQHNSNQGICPAPR